MVPPDAELELFNKLKAEYGAFPCFFPILISSTARDMEFHRMIYNNFDHELLT